jgi:DNA-directed RNA polymerase subunit M/transcription elongation factor TFIIS
VVDAAICQPAGGKLGCPFVRTGGFHGFAASLLFLLKSGCNALGKRMSIPVHCAACGSTFNVNEQYAGQRFACRNCLAALRVPSAPIARPTKPAHSSVAPDSDPSALRVTCPGCSNVTLVNVAFVGRRVRCKQCGQEFKVAGPTSNNGGARPTSPASRNVKQRSRSQPGSAPAPAIEFDAGPRVDDLLGGLDEGALAVAPESALKPLPAPVVRKPRNKKQSSQASFGGIDPIWGGLAVAWTIAAAIGIVYAYAKYNVLLAAFAFSAAVSIAHLVCYGLVLLKIGSNGNPGFAILCFVTLGIGEIFALASASNNVRQWKMERILPVWQFLFAMLFVAGGVVGAAIFYDDGHTGNPFQKKRQERPRKMAATSTPTPSPAPDAASSAAPAPEPFLNPGPAKPAEAPTNSINTAPIPGPPMPPIEKFGIRDAFTVQVSERLTANREGLAEFLPTMVDVASVQAAAPRFQQFETEYRDTAQHRPNGFGLSSQEFIDKVYLLNEREWKAQEKIKIELKRIEAIPDAARLLQLGGIHRPEISKPQPPRSGPLKRRDPRFPGRRY